MLSSPSLARPAPDLRAQVMRKLNRRIVLFCFVLFIINYLDRVNVGFAALEMNQQLGLTPKVFGFGAGIFFLGYMLFEVPSNLILHKVGPRIWIARILVTWGIVSCAMAMIQGPTSFYVMRFLLGAAEAGFFPGVLYYITQWFPVRHRGKILGLFILSQPIAMMITGPISGPLPGP